MSGQLTKPSEITETGWYWAEVSRKCTASGDDYELTVLEAWEPSPGVIMFAGIWDDESWYQDQADQLFRIIDRIEEPEIRGGWS